IAGGDFTSQSRMRSVSTDLSGRRGARLQGANEAPVVSASRRLHGSLITRTACPRATNRRTTASIGGVVPPPSPWVNRNVRGMTTPLGQCAADKPADYLLSKLGIEIQVAPQQFPQINVRRRIERRDPFLSLIRRPGRQMRMKRLGQPAPMEPPRIVEHAVKERQLMFLLERPDVHVADLLVLIHQTRHRSLDVARRRGRPKGGELDFQLSEGRVQDAIARAKAPKNGPHGDAGCVRDLVERDVLDAANRLD